MVIKTVVVVRQSTVCKDNFQTFNKNEEFTYTSICLIYFDLQVVYRNEKKEKDREKKKKQIKHTNTCAMGLLGFISAIVLVCIYHLLLILIFITLSIKPNDTYKMSCTKTTKQKMK